MLKELAEKYYIDNKLNCSEAIFLSACQQYGVSPSDSYKAISSFGGGAGFGSMCGAAAGACAFLGLRFGPSLGKSAHETELPALCKQFMTEFSAACQSELCRDIMPRFKTPEMRCFKTVAIAADILEAMLK